MGEGVWTWPQQVVWALHYDGREHLEKEDDEEEEQDGWREEKEHSDHLGAMRSLSEPSGGALAAQDIPSG